MIDTFIHHIDAVDSHTLIYNSDCITNEADIIRLIEKIKSFYISGNGVLIFYESGAELLIQRLRD
jgi:hypothetical protein